MDTQQKQRIPQPVVHGLAVVGFVALVAAGMTLAVYGARFVPGAVSSLSGAAVSLISVFVPDEETPVPPVIVEAPTGTTTPPVGTTTPANPSTPTGPGHEVVTVYPEGGAPSDALYGSPDLAVSIVSVGYLRTSNSAFVETNEIPENATRVIVKFAIENRGTNVAERGWRFNASLPSRATDSFRSDPQQALLPRERIEYTLGFERPIEGNNQPIAISVNAKDDSVSANNAATRLIDVAD